MELSLFTGGSSFYYDLPQAHTVFFYVELPQAYTVFFYVNSLQALQWY